MFVQATKDMKRGDVGWLDYGDSFSDWYPPRSDNIDTLQQSRPTTALPDVEDEDRGGPATDRGDVEGNIDSDNEIEMWSEEIETEIFSRSPLASSSSPSSFSTTSSLSPSSSFSLHPASPSPMFRGDGGVFVSPAATSSPISMRLPLTPEHETPALCVEEGGITSAPPPISPFADTGALQSVVIGGQTFFLFPVTKEEVRHIYQRRANEQSTTELPERAADPKNTAP